VTDDFAPEPAPAVPLADGDEQDPARAPGPDEVGSVWRPLLAAVVVTAIVTALSWLVPPRHAATAVGLGFLTATYVLVMRGDEDRVRHFGLSLGGLFERTPLSAKRLLVEGATALAWAFGFAALVFPLFVKGYALYWHPRQSYHFVLPPRFWDDIAGQVLVIALPEEAFFRGYLQTALDDATPRRLQFRFLGAVIGPSLFATSAIFAVGHVLTEPRVARLAVFFPSLLFGWMRARTKGIGAALAFHAFCNLLVSFLAHGFGLIHG
jgi:uncharacterized protein